MTLTGLAIPESVTDQSRLGAAIDARPVKPDVVAIWAQGLRLDAKAWREARDRGIEAIVYAQTARWPAELILSGFHDTEIDRLAIDLMGTDTIVRLNQEANGPGLRAEWNTWSPETYIAVFRYISDRIRYIAWDAQMAYCITWRGLRKGRDDFARWYPGHDACQIVGFDSYVTNPIQRPSRIWPVAIRTIRETTPTKPVWVFETGIARGIPFRGRRLREMLAVPGLAGVVVMDMDLMHHGVPHLWALNERLRRLWGRLGR